MADENEREYSISAKHRRQFMNNQDYECFGVWYNLTESEFK